MIQRATIRKNQYQDSVRLMTISREAGAVPGVDKVLALLGTDSNKRVVQGLGLLDAAAAGATANDLLVCVAAEERGRLPGGPGPGGRLPPAPTAGPGAKAPPLSSRRPRPASPGPTSPCSPCRARSPSWTWCAALECGLHVMLFSDNIPVADEVELKNLAVRRGRLLMGPDCGTAIVNGVPLALANVVRRGEIGVVGASGTGIQEVTCLLDRLGAGITHALGVGGRDLQQGGRRRMMRLAPCGCWPTTRRPAPRPGRQARRPRGHRAVLEEAAGRGPARWWPACWAAPTAAMRDPGVTAVDTLEEAALRPPGATPRSRTTWPQLRLEAARLPA